MLAHRPRVVVDRGCDDVQPDRVAVPLGRREVRRERQEAAKIRRRLDDLDPFVGRHRHEIPLDEVPASPAHRDPVCLEGVLERRRMVRLQPVDDLGLRGARVDLARGGGACRVQEIELLPADLEDGI